MTRYVQALVRGMRRCPGREALVFGDRRLSHAEVVSEASRMAHALAVMGLRPGDGVVCWPTNVPEDVLLRLAVHLVGARYTALNHVLSSPSQGAFLDDLAPAAVVVPSPRVGTVVEMLRAVEVPQVLALGASGVGRDLVALAAEQSATPPNGHVGEQDLSQVSCTSGSTGRPKGVCRSFAWADRAREVTSRLFGDGPWRFLLTCPLSSVGGDFTVRTLAGGGTVELRSGFDPHEVAAIIRRGEVTHLFLRPSELCQLLDETTLSRVDLAGVRQILYGSAPTAPSRIDQAVKRFGPVLTQFYGQMETSVITVLTTTDHSSGDVRRLSSVGRPVAGVRVRVRDPQGQDLPAGEIGEIHVHSPTVMDGYWKLPELTSCTVRSGWLATGDLGCVDDDGYLHLVDRIKDVIIVDGYNVYSSAIENALTSCTGVRQAAVVGVADADAQERVHAVIVTEPAVSVTRDELRARVREQLGPLHVPASIEFTDHVPVAPSGKPDKQRIRRSATFTESGTNWGR